MASIPEFSGAIETFQSFLANNSLPDTIVWVFRGDTFLVTPDKLVVRSESETGNEPLVAKVYEEGRAKGLVEIVAIGRGKTCTFATVWFPKLAEDEVQGWSAGLKLSIRKPCPTAEVAGRITWALLQWNPAFRRYQRTYGFIGTREWAAA